MAPGQVTTATFPQQLLAGGVAGISEILIMYYFWACKRVPIRRGENETVGGPALACRPYSPNILKTAATEHKRDRGVLKHDRLLPQDSQTRRYWPLLQRDPGPDLDGDPQKARTHIRATKFTANDSWAKFYADIFQTQRRDQKLAILTGASAGATESIVVVPFELVKIRLQDKSSSGRYKGVLDCAVKIVRESGPLGLYQGFESTVWRHIIWNAGYFGCIFQVRSLLPKAETKRGTMVNDLIAGSVGGTVGTLLNTPFDVVKSRIQSTTGAKEALPWVWSGILKVYKEEGVSALYKGLVPKVVRFAPGGGIMLVVYSFMIDLLTSGK
ncbi:hypothetical protein CEP53_013095 [Fusarium sp. AF-6]|nr:hypothetical protein CEP53_013095 [Fusarium sp. AF-6]